MSPEEARLRVVARQQADREHAALLARKVGLPRPPHHKEPKRTVRQPKPDIPSVAPAVLASARAELARQMDLSSKGGRPALMRRSSQRGGVKGGAAKSAAHREAIAEAMRAKWAARREG